MPDSIQFASHLKSESIERPTMRHSKLRETDGETQLSGNSSHIIINESKWRAEIFWGLTDRSVDGVNCPS